MGPRYQPKPLKHGDEDTCTCPHCWTVFPYGDALYVARHPELRGDPMLGDVPSRFRPTRFTAEGLAIDPGGFPCLEMACPACHLEVPRSLSEFRSVFFSIVGALQTGKSFFLTSATWHLRKVLASHFAMAYTDLETSLNAQLHEYERALFFPKNPDEYTTLKKTELQGELYNPVTFDGSDKLPTHLPRPFLFTLKPQRHHPEANNAAALSRTVILYDNAGEHFNPDQDTATQPGTMHMARSECLFFVLDPTQDPRFRARIVAAAGGKPADPQLEPGWHINRQDVCFNEAARRIRRHVSLPHGTKYKKPVVVVVNKFDLWDRLLPIRVDPEPFVADRARPVQGLSVGYVEDVSFTVRSLLQEVCPEVVTAVEDFARHVTYIPVSTIGHSPVRREGGPGLYVKPSDVRPFWVTIPFLYAFARLGLVFRGQRSYSNATPRAVLLGQPNGMLSCGLPDGSRIDVPDRLAGKLLHHPKTGRPFVVPTAPAAALPAAPLPAAPSPRMSPLPAAAPAAPASAPGGPAVPPRPVYAAPPPLAAGPPPLPGVPRPLPNPAGGRPGSG